MQDGIRDSFAHMSPARDDASQGTFFEIYGNLVYDISYIIKKVCKTESEIPLHICRPQGGDASQGTFFEVYGNLVYDIYHK